MYDPAHFLRACQPREQTEEVVLLLSSLHHSLCHVLCISGKSVHEVEVRLEVSKQMANFTLIGGVSLGSGDVKPPHLAAMPHCVESYRLVTELLYMNNTVQSNL